MTKVRVNAFSVSLDGYGAGCDQSVEHPMGVGGQSLHGWAFPTRAFQAMFGNEGGETGVDEDFATESMAGLGAWVMGRNMFGPVRGAWPDLDWKGWWGANPPYHTPVFVLTHHARPSLEMEGGTVFHFVTEGADVALERAVAAAGDKDVRIGGGVATIRHYLEAGKIDEMHLALAPVLLGRGEPLLAGLDLPALGYEVARYAPSARAAHLVVRKA